MQKVSKRSSNGSPPEDEMEVSVDPFFVETHQTNYVKNNAPKHENIFQEGAKTEAKSMQKRTENQYKTLKAAPRAADPFEWNDEKGVLGRKERFSMPKWIQQIKKKNAR